MFGKVANRFTNSLKMEDDEFMEYIIEGIPDQNLRNTAKLQCFSTKNEILQAFRNIELYSTRKTINGTK